MMVRRIRWAPSVETLHYAELSHVLCVFSFHLVQMFQNTSLKCPNFPSTDLKRLPAWGIAKCGRKPSHEGIGNGCGGATAQPLQTGALHGEQGPQADGGTAWRSAAAHRHDTRLRIPKQVRKFPTEACFF